MKPLRERNGFRVGLGTIGVGLLICGLVVAISVIPFGKDTYSVLLSQTAGLRAKEDVQINGVPVGQIRSIAIEGKHVRVKFTVDSDIHLGPQTTADVKVATLLGTHLLALKPRGSGDLPNDTIPMSQTSVPFNLQDVIEQGSAKLDEIDPKLIAQTLTTLTNELGPASDELGPALTGVAQFSSMVNARSEQFGELLTAARNVSDQLSRSSGDIIALMKQTNLVVSEVTARRDAIHRLLVETTRLSKNLVAIIDQTRADMKPALQALNDVLGTLHKQDDMLKGVLDTMAPALRYVANATGNGPWADLYLKSPALPPDDVKCNLGDCR